MMTAAVNTDVLICGAGPTGLVLALRLVRLGVGVRIVDAAAEPGTTSRALVVHARTLEFYRQMGLAEELLQDGLRFAAVNLWVRARQVGHVVIGELGKGISAYPFMTVHLQDRHERFLIEHLRRAGIKVERQTALVDFAQAPDRVRIRLKHASGEEETCETAYVAGCDGAHSRVREVLGVGFPGGTYSHVFYVADVVASGPVINDELHVALDDADFLGIFPLKGGRTGRLIGTVPAEDEDARESLRWEDVGRHVAERMGIQVSVGKLGRVHGGDRLPWVGLDGSSNPTDNFAVLDGLEWQVHVYGLPGPGLAEACQTLGLPLHVFAWRPTMRKAGLTQDGLDEHVALVDSGKSPAALAAYMAAIRTRKTGL